MPLIEQAARAVVFGFLGVSALIVALQLLRRDINLSKLLCRKSARGSGVISPERVQLLVVTIAVASEYVLRVMRDARSAHMPDIPVPWLAAFGASHSVYLMSKAVTFYRSSAEGAQ